MLNSLSTRMPTKTLGQNFLVSCRTQNFLLNTMKGAKSEQSLELCSGYGALTRGLCKARTRLVGSIEIDVHISFLFSKRFNPILSLFMVDALLFSYKRIITSYHLILLGNISFRLTKNLLPNILSLKRPSCCLFLMLYASDFENLVRRPELSSYLSYSLGFKVLALFGSQHFFPEPDIDCSYNQLQHRFELDGRYGLLSV